MKLKTEKEIKTLSEEVIEQIQSLLHSYDESLDFLYGDEDGKKELLGIVERVITQAQQDLLSQASEGFEEYAESIRGRDAFNPCDNDWSIQEVEGVWQASRLSMAKEMQEKDVEIEALTKEKDAWKTMYLELRNRVAGG